MSILAAMLTSADALKVFDQALGVTQNNVVNASTPGYVKQTLQLEAEKFDPSSGEAGGVRATDIHSARDEFADQAVRRQITLLGESTQTVNSLTDLQSSFDISGNSGIPKALNDLFQAFSAWGQTPGDTTARQNVINAAGATAAAFQDTAVGLAQVTRDTQLQLQQTVDRVNRTLGDLATYNAQIMAGDRNDAGLDAQVHSTLEQLAQDIGFTASKQTDGSYQVMLNGQIPLVIEDRQYNISYTLEQPADPDAPYPTAPPDAHIHGSDGADITSNVVSGQLGGLLNVRNNVLASYIGNAYHPGDLNDMAKKFADRVNSLLTSGSSTDPEVTSGAPQLFIYDSAMRTLAVNPQATASTLVAADPATGVATGIPLALSQLANPIADADKIGGQSYTEFYGAMAGRVGTALNTASSNAQVRQGAVAQAQNLRQQKSGVNLDEEAMTLVQFQRAYEANSRLITVLSQLTDTVINMVNG